MHPTFVHAAADLRRQALLREALADQQWSPAAPTRSLLRRASHLGWTIATGLVQGITVVVDSFEPRPRNLVVPAIDKHGGNG
jgi:hypothetical protein